MFEHATPTFFTAFFAGLLSFVSPCVLPLIPGYLSYISGVTLDDMQGTGSAGAAAIADSRRRVVIASLFFVLGFSVVFVSLGAAASAIGQFLQDTSRMRLLGKIAGAVVFVFGLHTMGLLRIDKLYSEKRVQMERKPRGAAGAFLVGLVAIAGTQETVGQGVRLLAIYSLGLGVPFLLTSIAINQFFSAFARIRRHYHAIEVTSGVLLCAIGVLIFTNRFTIIAQYLSPYLPTF
jgi:cytochrome c-type biogenesis protein